MQETVGPFKVWVSGVMPVGQVLVYEVSSPRQDEHPYGGMLTQGEMEILVEGTVIGVDGPFTWSATVLAGESTNVRPMQNFAPNLTVTMTVTKPAIYLCVQSAIGLIRIVQQKIVMPVSGTTVVPQGSLFVCMEDCMVGNTSVPAGSPRYCESGDLTVSSVSGASLTLFTMET